MARPCFKATTSDHNTIEQLEGRTRDDIANAIGVTRKTLSKHFAGVLRDGRRKSKKVPLEPFATAKQETPLDYMLAVMNDISADPVRRDRMAVAAAPYVHGGAASKPLGKKAAALVAAQDAVTGTSWESLLAPGPPPPKVPKAN